MTALRERLRTLAASGWLGWTIESSWADPVLFFVYFLVRPLATALILVVIYRVATGAAFATPLFAALFVGHAFFLYVHEVVVGMSMAVHEDRENYQMLKYLWSAPIRTSDYLLGRGLAGMATGTVAVGVTLAAGALVLGIRPAWESLSLLRLAASLLAGLAVLAGLGLFCAGVELNKTHMMVPWQEGLAGLLYLLSGAVFPPELLPRWLQPVSWVLPTTWWLESVRRALLGRGWCAALAGWSDGAVLAMLTGMAALFLAGSLAAYEALDQRARRTNRIEMTTGF